MDAFNHTKQLEETEFDNLTIRQWIIAVTFAILMIVGLLGNTLVIIIACKKPVAARNSTSIFILNLSIADLLFLLFCAPFTASVLTMNFWVFGRFICKMWNFVIFSSMLASIYSLVVLSLDRYFKTSFRSPTNSLGNRWGVFAVIIIWIIAAGFASPCLVVYDIRQIGNTSKYVCYDSLWKDQLRQKPRYLLFLSVVGYGVPLTLLILTYASIVKITWKASRMGLDNSVRKSRIQVTIIISVMVLAFGLSWLPHNVFNIWVAIAKDKFPWTDATFRFKIASWCLMSLHSCLNPLVYFCMSRVFRQAAKTMILECRHPPQTRRFKTQKPNVVLRQRYRRSLSHLSARYKHRPLFYI
ncbi:Galanin receptor type 1 [Holothuria leucospilota]|uniref:Galanin receptor type 1 n=1 Tax=Holothuria leucospilota TaxID=206669 RepID=A0A9Q1C3C5_HOLLE|nr:Galanin receptor type 1 [Holothuria leucospilota]